MRLTVSEVSVHGQLTPFLGARGEVVLRSFRGHLTSNLKGKGHTGVLGSSGGTRWLMLGVGKETEDPSLAEILGGQLDSTPFSPPAGRQQCLLRAEPQRQPGIKEFWERGCSDVQPQSHGPSRGWLSVATGPVRSTPCFYLS